MKPASIIIPTYHRLDRLQRCVESIRTHTFDVPHEIIIVDNASRDETAEWCRRSKIPVLSLPRHKGFSAACNKGLRVASGETLVLLNNDTVVTPGWLSNLSAALYSSQSVGIVGPLINGASGSQQVDYLFEARAGFQRNEQQDHVSNPALWKKAERIAGVCIVFRRGLMERIGGLDEASRPVHYEDDDYGYRARLQGLELLVCHDTLIYHEGSTSFRNEGASDQ